MKSVSSQLHLLGINKTFIIKYLTFVIELTDNSIQLKKDLEMFLYQLRIEAEVFVEEMVSHLLQVYVGTCFCNDNAQTVAALLILANPLLLLSVSIIKCFKINIFGYLFIILIVAADTNRDFTVVCNIVITLESLYNTIV